MRETIYINGKDIRDFGAEGQRDYTIGGTQVTNEYFQGRNRTSYVVLASFFGMKTIQFTLVFSAKTRHEALLNKSCLDALLFGKPEIYMPDGFYYSCILNSIGDIEWQGQDGNLMLAIASYQLTGMQHGELVTVLGDDFICSSTMEKTDCILSVTVSQAAETYALGGAIFHDVAAGEKLVFDGINKRILRNGAPGAANVEWINFPSLAPGKNSVTAADPVTVEYYPTYM